MLVNMDRIVQLSFLFKNCVHRNTLSISQLSSLKYGSSLIVGSCITCIYNFSQLISFRKVKMSTF